MEMELHGVDDKFYSKLDQEDALCGWWGTPLAGVPSCMWVSQISSLVTGLVSAMMSHWEKTMAV
uniref:Uncharacterized protein n=1 Tax=Piliocolobus tephrosceles TaxID=591936 RepID=A0A8C9HFH2_9PRIM